MITKHNFKSKQSFKWPKWLIFSTYLLSLLSLAQPAWSAITVTEGNNQSVPVGTSTADIYFRVVDDTGNPSSTPTSVNFSLLGPTGNPLTVGLSNTTATTDTLGRVSTRLNIAGKAGNYTVVATVSTDPKQIASANVVVTAGIAAKLTIMSGGNQLVSAGQPSADIVFRLTDAYDNAITQQTVSFKLQTPTGETKTTGIIPTSGITNSNGDVTTRLEATDIKGIYQVIATPAQNAAITGNTSIQVTYPISSLPNLGLGISVTAAGVISEIKEVSFYGGTSINDAAFAQDAILQGPSMVIVKGMIKVASAHIGQPADIIVVGVYQSTIGPFAQPVVFMIGGNSIQVWDGLLASLVPMVHVNSLPESQIVNMYAGPMQGLGQIQLYFGYRLADGNIIFNGNQMVSILLK